ncbi:MAG: redoxin domain-containing protein [Caldilineales bacterium]|nr:redoxin domain-containing protein [Caldilineales bacterium]
MTLPPLGAPAPDFVLPGADGELIQLSGFQDRAHVVLAFYPFDFSPICSVQLPGLQAQARRFAELDAVVLGISTDSPHSHRAFAAELGLEFPLLSDFFGKAVSEIYGVLRPEGYSERATFIIDKQGILRHAQVHELGKAPDVEALLHALAGLNHNTHD